MLKTSLRTILLTGALAVLAVAPAAVADTASDPAAKAVASERQTNHGYATTAAHRPSWVRRWFGLPKERTYKYSAKIKSAPLSSGNGYPAPGGTALLAGSLKSRPFGAGAVVDDLTITGQPESNVFTFEGTEVVFFADGTLRDKFSGSSTVAEDGSQAIEVTGKITDGTARFSGATGRFKFSGTVPSGATVMSGHSTGRVTF